MLQKSQRRVHWSPPMRKVASRSSQHSCMLGQLASWHTVCRDAPETRSLIALYSGPVFAVVRIQDGLFSMGVSAFFASMRSKRRPSGAVDMPITLQIVLNDPEGAV